MRLCPSIYEWISAFARDFLWCGHITNQADMEPYASVVWLNDHSMTDLYVGLHS